MIKRIDKPYANIGYIWLCRKFHSINLPKIKFRELDERYKLIYKNKYGLYEDDINKATFVLLLTTFIIVFSISILFTQINILLIMLYSFISSISLSYIFNSKLFKETNRKEVEINAMLYLVKIYYSLIQKSLEKSADYAVTFINLIKDYNLPISENFKNIIKKLQEGENPEDELFNIITPSEDFNRYLKELIITNYEYSEIVENIDGNSLEKRFKIFLKQIESKLSIIFFIGLFYPLGLSFLILFQRVNTFLTLLLLPIYFIILKLLYKKFVRTDHYLIGLMNDYSKLERKRYDEFLLFLKGFAINLRRNLAPETSFLNSYTQNKSHFVLLMEPIQAQISRLLNFNCSFEEMLDFLKLDLKSIKYGIIIEIIKRIVYQNAYESSQKILQILEVIHKHQNLERKLEVIVKGEKFKVFLFLFLLPVIIGGIGGMFPFFILLLEDIDLNNGMISPNFFTLILTQDVFFLFGSLLFCLSITSLYFLKIIRKEKMVSLIFIVNIVYTLIFFFSFFNVLNYF